MSQYVEIEDVEYLGSAPSRKAFFVRIEGRKHSIPNSTVSDESELFVGTEHEVGTLRVAHWFAEKEGLVDGEPEGSGVLYRKRPGARVKQPPRVPSAEVLAEMRARADASTACEYTDDGYVYDAAGEPVGCFDAGSPEENEANAALVACAADDVRTLLDALKAYQIWATKVVKGRSRS